MAASKKKQIDELRRQIEAAKTASTLPEFSVDGLCGAHVRQAAALDDFLHDPNRRSAWMTARRAGKTTAAAYALALLAMEQPNSNLIYIGLTKEHARTVILEEIFRPIVEKYRLPAKPNESRQDFVFENGSVVKFTGSDDLRNIRVNLGTRLDGVVIDEMQDQDHGVAKKLIIKILPPALGDGGRGRMLLCGTKPESPRSFWWELYDGGKYVTHNWSGRDNPYYVDFSKELADFCELNNLSIDDPLVQSDWLGNLDAWTDANAPFAYDDVRNRHTLKAAAWCRPDMVAPGKMRAVDQPTDVQWCSVGIDPGSGDRWALVLWGWSKTKCYQLAEWVAPRGSNVTTWDPCKAVLDLWHEHYRPITRIYRDAGSTKETTELFGRFMQRYVLAAANKQARRSQVERFSTYLQRGTILCIPNSSLEEDLKLARWKQSDLDEGRHEWDDSIVHPDVADAGRYGLQGYFEVPRVEQDEKPLTEVERWVKDEAEAHRRQFAKPEQERKIRRRRSEVESLWSS